jgi:hypothetical protein
MSNSDYCDVYSNACRFPWRRVFSCNDWSEANFSQAGVLYLYFRRDIVSGYQSKRLHESHVQPEGLPRRLPSSNEAASLWVRYGPLPHLADLLQGPQGRLGDSWI